MNVSVHFALVLLLNAVTIGQAAPLSPAGVASFDAGSETAPRQRTPPTSPMRTWTDASGDFTVQARLVKFDRKMVRLLAADGKTIDLSIERFCAADQSYLRATTGRKSELPPRTDDWIELIGPKGPTGIAKIGDNMTLCGDVRLGPGSKSLTSVPGGGVVAVLSKVKYGGANNLLSKQQFGDCDVQLEFLIAKESNSGVKLQERYEVQLFDSHGKAKPTAKDCGGVYPHWRFRGKGKGLEYIDKGFPPREDAAKPAGQWQTLEIVFTAPRFDSSGQKTENARFHSVVLNGKTIHENVELNSPTGNASTPMPETSHAPLFLQLDHGAVAFRNVRVRPFGEKRPRVVSKSAPAKPVASGGSPAAKPRSPSASPAHRSVALPGSMEVIRLADVSHPEVDDCDPWISFDGRSLYWCRYDCDSHRDPVNDPEVLGMYCASRSGPDARFEDPRRLFPKRLRHPTVSADGLTLACVAKPSPVESPKMERVCIATRSSLGAPFEDLHELEQVKRLCPHPYYKFPCFDESNTRLSFAHFTARDVYSLTWPDPAKPFENASPEDVIGLDSTIQGNHPWPILTDDNRFLICCHEARIGQEKPGGGLMLWRREKVDETFTEGVYLTLPGGKRIPCRAPRYCAATKELFFTSKNLQDPGKFHNATWDLWVIKGFDPRLIEFAKVELEK